MQKVIVKNPSGNIVYTTNNVADAQRFRMNHEMNGLSGFTIDFIEQ